MGYSTYSQCFVVFCQGRPCQLYSDWCSVSTQACGGGLRWCLDVRSPRAVWDGCDWSSIIISTTQIIVLGCLVTSQLPPGAGSFSREQSSPRNVLTKAFYFLVNCIFPVKAAIIVVHFLSHNNSQQTWDPVRAVGHLDSWTVRHTGLLLPDRQRVS